MCGPSFEGFCIDNLIAAAGVERTAYFYRTQVGAEIDLVLEKGGRPDIAIEVKRASAPRPERGFSIACDDLKITRRYVVYPGVESFALRNGAQAISLAQLCAELRDSKD